MTNNTPTAAELRRLQQKLNLSNAEMGELLGISSKTWSNKTAPNALTTGAGKLQKLEYEFLLLLAKEHPVYKLTAK